MSSEVTSPKADPPLPPIRGRLRQLASELGRLFSRFFGLFKKGELPFWVIVGAILLVSLWLATRLQTKTGCPVAQPSVVYTAVAFCFLSTGCILGFLFGIPHLDASQAPSPDSTAGRGASKSRPSTNLEQVSDWLTKIIVGLGLVEAREVEVRLARLGSLVHDAVGGSAVLPQFLAVTFAVLGFLAGYIWTRLYYGGMQVQADVDAWNLQEVVKEVKDVSKRQDTQEASTESLQKQNLNQDKVLTRLATGKITNAQPTTESTLPDATDSNVPPSKNMAPPDAALAAWNQHLALFKAAPARFNSDPARKIFGALPSDLNGRRLEVTMVAALQGGLDLEATVTSYGSADPVGEVVFLLHPTFPQRVLTVPLIGGKATLNFFSEGWFTLIAMADAGKTVLAFNLQKVPGAPLYFLEN